MAGDMADNGVENSEAEVLEEYVTGYQRLRLPSGVIVVAAGPELAERLTAAAAARQRSAATAAQNAEMAARNDELSRELEALRNVRPDPAEVARLRAELREVRGENLSLRAAVDALIRLQNGGAESLGDGPELPAVADAGTGPLAPAGALAPPRDGVVPPASDDAEPELTPLAVAVAELS